jgi:hypothetical protein
MPDVGTVGALSFYVQPSVSTNGGGLAALSPFGLPSGL